MLNKWLLEKAIEKSLKKPTPNRISYASNETAKIDYYLVVLKSDAGLGFNVIVNELYPNHIEGLQWDGNKYAIKCSLQRRFLSDATVTITRYLREARTEYRSEWDFWLGEITGVTKRYLLRRTFDQWLYNKRTRFRRDRIDLLKDLVDRHIAQREENGILADPAPYQSALTLFEALYGTQVFAHPRTNQEYRRFELILASLADGGELERQNGRYKVAGRALSTIANFEEVERRHLDSVRLNRVLAVFTIVLAISAVVELFV